MVVLEVAVLLVLLSLVVGGIWLMYGVKFTAGKNMVRQYNQGYNAGAKAVADALKKIKHREDKEIDRIVETLKL